jgi:hypothetical protein
MKNILLFIAFIIPFGCLGQNLYFLQEDGQAQADFVIKNEIGVYKIIYENKFVSNDLLDEVKLKKEIIKSFPQSTASGFGVLDWEGHGMQVLTVQDNDKDLRLYISQFVKALKIAKRLRPNVRWAFYALPFREYWNVNTSFKKKNYRIGEIFENQGFIAPSLYIFYPDESSSKRNKEYITNNVEFALELGNMYKKAVYPFIWHRVHPSNRMYGEQLAPISVFSKEVSQILNTSYNGNKVSGLMWWQSENHIYRNRAKSRVFSKEYNNNGDPNTYQKSMFQQYYDSIEQYFGKNRK